MKKNYLFGLCAASMLLMTSCEKDSFFGGMWQGEKAPVTVNLNVALPELQSATRTATQFGNGYSAQNLNYAVYEIMTEKTNQVDENGKPVFEDVDTIYLAAQEVRDAKMNSQLSKTIALKLMPGSTYEVVFWAQHHEQNDAAAPYTCNFNKIDGKAVIAEVTLDYDKIYTNNEINDAFWGKVRIKNVSHDEGSVIDLGTVKLNRPFAQLNIGTADLQAAADAGFEVDKVTVSVSNNAYDALNLWNGKVTRSATASEGKVFKKNVVVNPELFAFPISSYADGSENKPLDHLAMNYILVSEEKETMNTVTLTYHSGDREKSRTFNIVPVQRNYRTNIYGELLTSDVKVQVTIDPIFADDMYNSDNNGNFPQEEEEEDTPNEENTPDEENTPGDDQTTEEGGEETEE